jgi:hypothetical protein
MADAPPNSDDTGTNRELTSTPRWVKVFGIIAIVVAVLFVILMFAGGGRHGPGRHRLSDGGVAGQTFLAGIAEGSHVLPEARQL